MFICSDLSLAMDVFLNLLIVTESSCNRSQPRRFSAFFNEAGLSDFTAGAFSYAEKTRTQTNMIVVTASLQCARLEKSSAEFLLWMSQICTVLNLVRKKPI